MGGALEQTWLLHLSVWPPVFPAFSCRAAFLTLLLPYPLTPARAYQEPGTGHPSLSALGLPLSIPSHTQHTLNGTSLKQFRG